MKLSEKQLDKIKELFKKSCFLDGTEIKLYGEICRLEGIKSEAKKNLKGIDKIWRLQDINKQLKTIAEKQNL